MGDGSRDRHAQFAECRSRCSWHHCAHITFSDTYLFRFQRNSGSALTLARPIRQPPQRIQTSETDQLPVFLLPFSTIRSSLISLSKQPPLPKAKQTTPQTRPPASEPPPWYPIAGVCAFAYTYLAVTHFKNRNQVHRFSPK